MVVLYVSLRSIQSDVGEVMIRLGGSGKRIVPRHGGGNRVEIEVECVVGRTRRILSNLVRVRQETKEVITN